MKICEVKDAECRRNKSGHCERKAVSLKIVIYLIKQRDQDHYWNHLGSLNTSFPSSTSFLCVSCSSSESCTAGIPGLSPTPSQIYKPFERRTPKMLNFTFLNPCTAEGTVSCLTVYWMVKRSPIFKYFHNWTRRSIGLKTGSNAVFMKDVFAL